MVDKPVFWKHDSVSEVIAVVDDKDEKDEVIKQLKKENEDQRKVIEDQRQRIEELKKLIKVGVESGSGNGNEVFFSFFLFSFFYSTN
jgi:hypothetical protein